MLINVYDDRIKSAISALEREVGFCSEKDLKELFEDRYHCKVIPDLNDPFCVNGWIDMDDEKYTWFVLQFGGSDDN